MSTPNILFLFSDHHRWDWLGSAGHGVPVRTPNLDRLAECGMAFRQCRCQSPLCAPSRASLATGLRPHRTGVPDNKHDLDESSLTYMQLLRNAGYRVATCGKCDLHKKTLWYGLQGWTARLGRLGFTEAIDQAGKLDAAKSGWPEPSDPYMAYLHAHGLAKIHCEDYRERRAREGVPAWPCPFERRHYTDDFCSRAALQLLQRLPLGEPWYLQVNFPGPHDPFDAPARLLQRYDDIDFDSPVAPAPEDPTDHTAVRRHFAAMIEGIDEWVGRIIDTVAARGELEDTIIVYSSDHGEMLGDHGRWGKRVPYEPSVHVPLIVVGPGIAQGVTSDALVELSDLAATFLEFAGIEGPDDWDARSFAPVLRGLSQVHRNEQVSMLGDWTMVSDGRWKLVETDGRPSALFDLQADPDERQNLASQPDAAAEVQRLHKALVCELAGVV